MNQTWQVAGMAAAAVVFAGGIALAVTHVPSSGPAVTPVVTTTAEPPSNLTAQERKACVLLPEIVAAAASGRAPAAQSDAMRAALLAGLMDPVGADFYTADLSIGDANVIASSVDVREEQSDLSVLKGDCS